MDVTMSDSDRAKMSWRLWNANIVTAWNMWHREYLDNGDHRLTSVLLKIPTSSSGDYRLEERVVIGKAFLDENGTASVHFQRRKKPARLEDIEFK